MNTYNKVHGLDLTSKPFDGNHFLASFTQILKKCRHKLFYGCDITCTIPILRKTFYFLEHCGLWLLLSVPLPPFANSLSHRTKFVRFASSWCSTISWWEENNFNWQIIYSVSVVGFSEYILHTYIITTCLGWNYNFFKEEIYK